MKPVVLLFFANDLEVVGNNLRKLAVEASGIENALESVGKMCDFHIQKNTTPADIRRLLAKYRNRVAIFHYAGHAESLRLMLETEAGGKEGFSAETLAAFLRNQDGLELVFLNGCSTDDQVDLLLDVGVPHVIATNQAIDDSAATALSTVFYEGLATGATIDVAWREAVAATKQTTLSSPRGAYFSGAIDKVPEISQQFPWSMRIRPGIDPVPKWNLPDASDNPLLGLPALPDDIQFPEEPFQHLHRFTRDEAKVFCGRGNEIRTLYLDVTDSDAAPVILYYGQSGVGKSSLLDAGLLPRLEKDFQVKYIRRSRWGIDRDLINAFGEIEGSITDRMPTDRDTVTKESLAHDASCLLDVWKQKEAEGKPVVIILDQIEEAWSQNTDADGVAEIGDLAVVLRTLFREKSSRPRGKIILAFRKEWFPEIDAALKTEKVSRSGVFLKRLSREGVARGILLSESARDHYGLRFEDPELANRIATELVADKDSPLAPTLQILLATMWTHASEKNRSEPCFSDELYSNLKKSGIQMGDFLDTQLDKVSGQDPAAFDAGLVHAVLMFHCSKLGTAIQLTEWQRTEFFGENFSRAEKVVALCKDTFLLTESAGDSSTDEGATRLAHDTLAPLVGQRFHDSTRLAQRVERILALRRQSVNSDLLSRSELSTVRQAKPLMRKLTAQEDELVRNSNKAVRKRNAVWISASVLVLVGFASLFLVLDAKQKRQAADSEARLEAQKATAKESHETEVTLARVHLLENADTNTISAMSTGETTGKPADATSAEASGQTTGETMGELAQEEELTWRAIAQVNQKYEKLSFFSGSRAKGRNAMMNAALLGAYLGKPVIGDLMQRLEDARPHDLLSFHKAHKAIKNLRNPKLDIELSENLDQLILDQAIQLELPDGIGNIRNVQRIQMRAKLTWLALFSGDANSLPQEWFEPAESSDSRTMLTIALGDWYMDQPEYRDVFKRDDIEPNRLAVLCQSIYFLPPSKVSPELASALLVHLNHPRITVRSSARAALTHLGKISPFRPSAEFVLKTEGDDWFSIEYKTAENCWNHLDFAKVTVEQKNVSVEDGKKAAVAEDHIFWLATTETPWEILNQSLSASQKFKRDSKLLLIRGKRVASNDGTDVLEKVESQYAPGRMVQFSDAVACCNWLSKQFSLNTNYVPSEVEETEINYVAPKVRPGFRLPTASEWSAANKIRPKDKFGFGNIKTNMQHFGWTLEYSEKMAHPVAHKLPNAKGFFDCYGNVREWCWPAEGAMEPGTSCSDKEFESEGGSYLDLRYQTGRRGNNDTEASNQEQDLSMGFRIAISKRPTLSPSNGDIATTSDEVHNQKMKSDDQRPE